MESRILKNNAHQKLSITKLLTNPLTIKMISALTTNKKRPKVTIVTGNVNKIKIGFTNTFSKPKTAAIMIPVT